jgi:hypothetical protein
MGLVNSIHAQVAANPRLAVGECLSPFASLNQARAPHAQNFNFSMVRHPARHRAAIFPKPAVVAAESRTMRRDVERAELDFFVRAPLLTHRDGSVNGRGTQRAKNVPTAPACSCAVPLVIARTCKVAARNILCLLRISKPFSIRWGGPPLPNERRGGRLEVYDIKQFSASCRQHLPNWRQLFCRRACRRPSRARR